MFFIDLIESKTKGIFTLLDEESKLPKPSFDHFTLEVHKAWNGHFRLSLPRTSRLKAHRTLRDEEGFLVRHFAGAVCYTTVSYMHTNYIRYDYILSFCNILFNRINLLIKIMMHCMHHWRHWFRSRQIH